ncbi:uncharacterized protein [Branchiostoma lanceolatum]|uniref:uncharacterized protein n=1 Tax=Branchiostoma lanceolatum TaxID=7740 RepID=UPI003451CD21
MKPPKRQRKTVEGRVYSAPASYRRRNLSSKWTLKDKKRILSALKRGCRHDDYNVLNKFVKNKTVEEVEEYMIQMKKRAETLASRGMGSDKEAERTPIETWLDTCSDLMAEVPPECTQAFSQVLTVAAAEPANLEEPAESPDYPAIYNYLSCLLRNATPPTLKPLDSAVVLDLLQSLADRLKTTDLSQLKGWLQGRYHDLKRSFVPDRHWENPFNLTREDLHLCDPQSTDRNEADDSAEQTSNTKRKTQTNPTETASTSRGRSSKSASTADVLASKSSSEDAPRGPSTSTEEPSTSSTSNKTQGGGKTQTSKDGGTKEAEEIMCLNPLRIPARYLELEKLDMENEESDSEE